ncbi:MAG TPA: two-component regulator propeller domain-containing protein [Flavisolibacter sp.]|nr:two-component regulator propeller domain-containing protein [Flavisolibacter sp.]
MTVISAFLLCLPLLNLQLIAQPMFMRGLLLILLFSFSLLEAQEPALYFEKITAQNGLSHNKVNCIIQDKRGFIWLGTDDGLNRYDGKNFVHFRHRLNDTSSISGNIITDLLEDKEGRLWIATADGGLSRYDHRLPPQQQFKQYKHLPGDPSSIPVNTVNALLEDRQGYLWLATSGRHVLRFNKQTAKFDDLTKSGKTALDLCQDKKGLIWVGRQGGGILKINPVSFAMTEDERYRDLYADLPHVTVTALYKDRADNIWFGSWDKTLYRHNEITYQEEMFQTSGKYSFQNDEILSFAEDGEGRVWMGGKEKGLHVYDKQTGRFYNFKHDPSREGTIADNRINCIFTDKNGRIWLGTNRGLCINQPDKQQFVQQFLNGIEGAPITIFDFYEDEQKSLWIGTNQGIFIRKADGSISQRKLSYKGTHLQISSFFKDDDGTFYLGTNYSLFKYNAAANSVSLLPNTEKDGVMNQIINSRVVSVLKDRIDGRPVLLTLPYGHFLAYYDLQKQRWVSRLDSMNILEKFNLKDNLIRKIYRAKNGTIWLANGKEGLASWTHHSLPKAAYFRHNPKDPFSIGNNNVYDLAEDDKGNLWVSTNGGGLHYFDTRTKKFTQVGGSNNLIEGLQVDHHQNVWMISNGNLHKYDPVRKTYTTYNLPDIEKTGGVKGKIFKDGRGKLYVGGTNFFIAFHPDSIRETRTEPRVFLTDFQIFNQSFSHLLTQDRITLQYKENYFAFEFAAPDFTAGSNVHYAYKLEGFDRDWVDAGERNYVSYSNLEGGDYTFKVRVTNTPGSWSKEIASMRMTIIPPYWKQPWFFAASTVFLALAIYAIYRYRINELVKRQAIRNKIAQDLHDNVGSTLSSISVYGQVARIYQQQQKEGDLSSTLEKISVTSSEMISELNDTVWAINPRNDNMEIILQRMESFAKPLLAAQNIHFKMRYDQHLTTLNLEMEKRKNFYAIFKETVNNVIKYSECKILTVDIAQKGSRIILKMQDDGKGFDLSKTSEGYKSSDVFGGGNGLKNMQNRAKEMKGILKMYSEPGKGTSVELNFPIT